MVGLRRAASLLAVAIAISVIAAAGASAAPSRSFYGLSSQTFLEPREIERMSGGGVGTLRTMLSWAAVDPTRGEADYAWGGFDAIVAESARNGITVLPFVFATPDWVARGLDGRRCGSRCELYAPRRRAARGAWKDFVGDAVDRYGRGGSFWAENPRLPRRPIRAWQIWNEQNSKSFYAPRPNVKGYAKLLDAAAGAIRARDRRADVILGGMAELAGSRKAVAGSRYLRELYRRRGARRNFDGVAPHPYGARLGGVREQVERVREQIKRAGDHRVGIWVTEIGWGSKSSGNPLNVGRRGQARRLEQAYRYFRRERGSMNVKNVTWFSWRDSRVGICDWCASSGLFSRALRAKPAWRAFARLTPGR